MKNYSTRWQQTRGITIPTSSWNAITSKAGIKYISNNPTKCKRTKQTKKRKFIIYFRIKIYISTVKAKGGNKKRDKPRVIGPNPLWELTIINISTISMLILWSIAINNCLTLVVFFFLNYVTNFFFERWKTVLHPILRNYVLHPRIVWKMCCREQIEFPSDYKATNGYLSSRNPLVWIPIFKYSSNISQLLVDLSIYIQYHSPRGNSKWFLSPPVYCNRRAMCFLFNNYDC